MTFVVAVKVLPKKRPNYVIYLADSFTHSLPGRGDHRFFSQKIHVAPGTRDGYESYSDSMIVSGSGDIRVLDYAEKEASYIKKELGAVTIETVIEHLFSGVKRFYDPKKHVATEVVISGKGKGDEPKIYFLPSSEIASKKPVSVPLSDLCTGFITSGIGKTKISKDTLDLLKNQEQVSPEVAILAAYSLMACATQSPFVDDSFQFGVQKFHNGKVISHIILPPHRSYHGFDVARYPLFVHGQASSEIRRNIPSHEINEFYAVLRNTLDQQLEIQRSGGTVDFDLIRAVISPLLHGDVSRSRRVSIANYALKD
jgi:hypothetical protein